MVAPRLLRPRQITGAAIARTFALLNFSIAGHPKFIDPDNATPQEGILNLKALQMQFGGKIVTPDRQNMKAAIAQTKGSRGGRGTRRFPLDKFRRGQHDNS